MKKLYSIIVALALVSFSVSAQTKGSAVSSAPAYKSGASNVKLNASSATGARKSTTSLNQGGAKTAHSTSRFSDKLSPLSASPVNKYPSPAPYTVNNTIAPTTNANAEVASGRIISWEGFRYFDNYTLNGPRMIAENRYAFFAMNFLSMANNVLYMHSDRNWTGKVLTIENETADTLYVSYGFMNQPQGGRLNRTPGDSPGLPFGSFVAPLESVQLKLFRSSFLTMVYKKDENGQFQLVRRFTSASGRGNYVVKIR
jgi:hypothetical protein